MPTIVSISKANKGRYTNHAMITTPPPRTMVARKASKDTPKLTTYPRNGRNIASIGRIERNMLNPIKIRKNQTPRNIHVIRVFSDSISANISCALLLPADTRVISASELAI